MRLPDEEHGNLGRKESIFLFKTVDPKTIQKLETIVEVEICIRNKCVFIQLDAFVVFAKLINKKEISENMAKLVTCLSNTFLPISVKSREKFQKIVVLPPNEDLPKKLSSKTKQKDPRKKQQYLFSGNYKAFI